MEGARKLYKFCENSETREDMTQYYEKWSDKYDKDAVLDGYQGPALVANALASMYSDSRENIRILDVAAGTGLVGEQLAKQGFVLIEALDPSQGMLDKAKEKNVYKTMRCEYFDETPLAIEPGTYDAIVVCGGCNNNHLPCGCLWEVIRLVKPGGYFVMGTRPDILNTSEEYKDHFGSLIDELENEGKWKKIRRDIVSRYIFENDGIIFVYQIL
ncbi:methyltransferase-like protein 27 [Argopecten irradians]|uniref:methyltransferase-like protein 27 n=1 Tax=Argopecten irradians TaxID=31199 RepID=UPI003723C5CA